jgi:hypothetical protein
MYSCHTSHSCFRERYSHRILFVFYPLHFIFFPSFLYYHIDYNYPQTNYRVHQRAISDLSVSFLFCYTYLPQLTFLRFGIIPTRVPWPIVHGTNYKSNNDITSKYHPYCFLHFCNFNNTASCYILSIYN